MTEGRKIRVNGIAIVGMDGRFPGAADLRSFWRNLRDGVESVSFFSKSELKASGLDPAVVEDKHYVGASGVLEHVDEFDAAFFGYTPREAERMDPQHRLFLETAWSALENAGYFAENYSGTIGVYAGSSQNTYLLNNLAGSPGLELEDLSTLIGNDKDFLSTRVSYHLDLTGPSVVVQSGCSTSLVAVAQACQALQSHQCDMALAGGVAIRVPQTRGYRFVPESTLSPDGHCRAFDARAQGTSFGSGLGIVVLKRVNDALADGDRIHAIIRGAAINNDGARKLSYTAPSVDRQAAVIAMAQALAEVDPQTIGYVEAHGTGTALGDPVEVAALTQAFRAGSERNGFCALGSVKTNIGHLDAASGISGLIKTVLSLEQRMIPPSLHFEQPNPGIDFAASPFFVNTELREWKTNVVARRAGVSSFGIGGTNVHLVLEEAPDAKSSTEASDRSVSSRQLIVLSARTATALLTMTANLAAHLAEDATDELADVAYTLQVGRKTFAHRRALVCGDLNDARRLLEAPDSAGVSTCVQPSTHRPVALLFPGEDSAHVHMGAELYRTEPIFRQHIDACCEQLRAHLGLDVRDVLYPPGTSEHTAAELKGTRLAQPAVFVTNYALARLLMEWGVRPEAMLGIGVGELVAACLTQVFRLEHALELVALRADWTIDLPQVDAESARQRFVEAASRVPRKPPELAFISGVTGVPITPAEAIDPEYWARQRVAEMRLDRGLASLLAEPARILLEVGPGSALCSLAQQRLPHPESQTAIHSMRAAEDSESETAVLLAGLGQLWLHDVPIDWNGVHAHRSLRRVALPTYPFERTRHWVSPTGDRDPAFSTIRSADPKDWFHVPTWKRVSGAAKEAAGVRGTASRWLVFAHANERWDDLIGRLQVDGGKVVVVRPSDRFARSGTDVFDIDPTNRKHYARLLEALQEAGLPTHVLHLWLAGSDEPEPARALSLGFFALYHLTDAFAARSRGGELQITVVTRGVQDVTGDELCPVKATVLGACRVLPQERPELRVRTIDVDGTPDGDRELLARLDSELERPITDPTIAYRRGYRWLPDFEQVELPPAGEAVETTTNGGLRARGVYLITGGLGGIGLTLAGFLAEELSAKLVLCGRSAASSSALRRVAELEAMGAEVLVLQGDVGDEESMARVVSAARERFGKLNGVIHAAGVAGDGMLRADDDPVSAAALPAKLEGTLILDRLCGSEPDFFVLASAVATALGGIGQADYCGANAFLDAFALMRRRTAGPRVLSIGWDTWSAVGMAADAVVPDSLRERQAQILEQGLTCDEGIEVFRRALASQHSHVLVSTTPLAGRAALLDAQPQTAPTATELRQAGESEPPAESPPKKTAASDSVEAKVTQLWTQLLGIDHLGPEDSFFEAGGNSLLATQMLSRLRNDFPEVNLSLRDLFDRPTIAGLAASIRESGGLESDEDERSFREQVIAANGGRVDLIEAFLRKQIAEAVDLAVEELPQDGSLEEFDQTLVAAHLSWALRQELELAVFPAEIRRYASTGSLARLIAGELDRMSLTSGEAAGGELAPAQVAAVPTAVTSMQSPSAHVSDSEVTKNVSMAFLLSAPRSGSTLLRLMLSAHSALFCPPELFLLDSEGMQAWSNDPFSDLFADGLVRAIMALRGVDYGTARPIVDGLVAANAPMQEVYRMLQGDGTRMLVDKTPTYALNLGTLHRAEEMFDSPRFIALVRHPFAVIESIVRNRLDRIRRLKGDPHQTAERYWVQTYQNITAFRQQIGEQRLQFVRYEELVREPEKVLRGVCEFLGVGFERELLDPYSHGQMFSGPGDPGLFERGTIDASLADAPERILLPRPLGEQARSLADEFGYELPG